MTRCFTVYRARSPVLCRGNPPLVRHVPLSLLAPSVLPALPVSAAACPFVLVLAGPAAPTDRRGSQIPCLITPPCNHYYLPTDSAIISSTISSFIALGANLAVPKAPSRPHLAHTNLQRIIAPPIPYTLVPFRTLQLSYHHPRPDASRPSQPEDRGSIFHSREQ